MPSYDSTGIAQGIAARVGNLVKGFFRVLRRPAAAAPANRRFDLSRSMAHLITENALLRHQLILLKRQSKRPKLSPADRMHLLLLAKITRTWRQVLMIVQPATLLR